MENGNWSEEVFNLSPQHRWTARPGNVVFVADRGAVRFEIPRGWHVEPTSNSVKFHDRKPPDDNMGIEMSIFYLSRLAVGVDWSGLSIHQLIKDATANLGKDGKTGSPTTIKLNGLEIAWVQREFIDDDEKRPAHSRIATARHIASAIQVVITMAYWPEDAEQAQTVWNDMMGTLKLGEYIDNPIMGPS